MPYSERSALALLFRRPSSNMFGNNFSLTYIIQTFADRGTYHHNEIGACRAKAFLNGLIFLGVHSV